MSAGMARGVPSDRGIGSAVAEGTATVSLPPAVQTRVDEIIQLLGLQALRPESLTIHFDKQGLAQDVKPVLSFRREKGTVDG